MRYLLFISFLLFSMSAFSQSRSNIGLGFGLNKPYSGDYNFGAGIQLQGDIAIGNQFAFSPDAGYSRINAKGGFVGGGSGGNPIDNLNLLYFRLSLRYYFYRNWFITGAPILYMAGENGETDGIGVGGSGSVGCTVDLDPHSTLAFSFNTDVINITSNGHGSTPIAGLKVAYLINFKSSK
ncbi:MAG: hypothetical protein ACXVI9_03865 [Mucilaginibacter sp.]